MLGRHCAHTTYVISISYDDMIRGNVTRVSLIVPGYTWYSVGCEKSIMLGHAKRLAWLTRCGFLHWKFIPRTNM